MDRERVHIVLKTVGCLCALVAISAGTARAQAEATVRGDVVAVADGSALSGVQVTLERPAGESRQTVTDAEGRFVFGVVRPGEYVVSARAEGFAARDVRLVVEPRDVQSVRLALDVGRVAIDVDVVAGVALASTHSPSSTMLTTDRLEQMPLSQHTNLPDAIVTAAPGMIRGHDDFVHIRGHEVALNPSINGVQFSENAHSVFSPGLGVDYIDSINVMTGGFSAEYGSRFGGILDVVTKSGLTMQNRGSLTFGSGTAQRHNAGVEFGGQRQRVAYT